MVCVFIAHHDIMQLDAYIYIPTVKPGAAFYRSGTTNFAVELHAATYHQINTSGG